MPTEEEITTTLMDQNNSKRIYKQELEADYNNYGERGYVDLYQVTKCPENDKIDHIHLFEVKANLNNFQPSEIVRQFTRMVKNFFGNSSRNFPKDHQTSRHVSIKYELTIYPSKENFNYIRRNKEIFENIREKLDDTIITFRCPCHGNIIHLFTPDTSIGDEAWKDYFLFNNPDEDCFSKIEEVLTNER